MSRLLLDTHVLLWALAGSRLSDETRQAVVDPANDVVVSAASAWEIAIKKALGKLDAPDDLEEQLVAARFRALSVTVAHAWRASTMPRHHSDPFDRMLIGQAQLEGLTIVTADQRFASYDVPLLPA